MNITKSKKKSKRQDQFSPTQLQSDISKETFTSPKFVYPLAIGGGLTVTAWALGLDTLGWSALLIGIGAILGAGGWAAFRQLFWRGDLVYQRLLSLQNNMLKEIEQKRAQLRLDLAAIEDPRGLRQLDNLTAKFELVTKRLRERFDTTEMTFFRYVSTAEQVYLGALDNLRSVVESCEVLSTMRRNELETLHGNLQQAGEEDDAKEIHERIQMYDRYQDRIQDALSDNEAALTRLSQVLEALVNLNTGQGMAKEPLDRAMEELAVLAQRTNDYET
ncbi:hypothetical protein [Sedimenticola sp.]|uniref:hypothetical protein n=1 Tax=Sedimenticola sp. TaxID=1940285 RepID=UPI003D09B804